MKRPFAAVFLSFLIFLQSGQACGPFLNETILDIGFAILRAPTTSFELEMARIELEPASLPGKLEKPDEIQSRYKFIQLQEETEALLFGVSGADLIADKDGCRTKLLESDSDLARDVAESAIFLKNGEEVEKYRALRTIMMPSKKNRAVKLDQADEQIANIRVQNRDWPDFLPEEFHLYLEGASDFSAQKWDAAAANFEKLLALPLEKRRYRSTWAAYMRARVELKRGDVDLKNSIVHFQRVLDAREDGCLDSLHLGWDALRVVSDHKMLNGETAEALRYRFALAWTGRGPVSPMLDLNRWAGRNQNGQEARDLSRDDPFVRQIFTASAINSVHAVEYWNKDVNAESNEWLDLLHSVTMTAEEAGSAAHFAYLLGDLKSAETFLKKAPTLDPTAIWLRSKLLAKAGQVRSASREMAKAESIPTYERTLSGDIPQFAFEPNSRAPWKDRAKYRTSQFWGEQGILHLANDHYEEAMEAFIKSGHWRDSAYVADQLLSREELLTYVRDRWPTHESAVTNTENLFAVSLRYLTARRLARDHYFKDARGLLPPKLVPVFDKYVENYRLFRDESKPEPDRAAAGWEAAQIHRRLGMELFGTEVAPDFTVFDGSYEDWRDLLQERLKLPNEARVADRVSHYRNPTKPEQEELSDWRQKREAESLARLVFPEPTPSEKWRWRHYAKLPNAHRFHYRHVAADLAWEAAMLMPIESDQSAQVLNIAGSWLSSRHPREADVFYKAMVRRNWSTVTGRLGDHFRWFVPHDWWDTYDPWKSLAKPDLNNLLSPEELKNE